MLLIWSRTLMHKAALAAIKLRLPIHYRATAEPKLRLNPVTSCFSVARMHICYTKQHSVIWGMKGGCLASCAPSSSTVTEWESQQIQSSQEKHHIASKIEKLIEVEGVNRKSYYWLDVVQIHMQWKLHLMWLKTRGQGLAGQHVRVRFCRWMPNLHHLVYKNDLCPLIAI